MTRKLSRRDFMAASVTAGLSAVIPAAGSAAPVLRGGIEEAGVRGPPAIHAPRAVKPLVISDVSGYRYRNGGPENSVERAFRGITEGEDVLDALIAGVNIPELDPEESGIGYGGLPNADGIVQLDGCCMHGPTTTFAIYAIFVKPLCPHLLFVPKT
jgi:N4-(beta-N-acetylglucosaminyl)-L-asparaginase